MSALNIVEARNGYTLSHEIEGFGDPTELQLDVIEDSGDERAAIKRLLEAVADHFGFHYDPFSSENINITFDRKGDEVE